jgi:hypothetical protein
MEGEAQQREQQLQQTRMLSVEQSQLRWTTAGEVRSWNCVRLQR